MTQMSVAIVSDHRLFAEGLERVLAADPSFSVSVAPGAVPPHSTVVILDGGMHEALPRCAEIARDGQLPVVLVGAAVDDEGALSALRAGARGILPRDAGFEQLVKAIRVVWEGQIWAPNQTVARALGLLSSPSDGHGRYGSGASNALTPREGEIVRYTLRGFSNKEIASRMVISPATVKAHLTSVFRKLSVRDRTQLVVRYHAQPPPTARPGRRSALPV
jgi:DNA-binding NarL/FixJ family response regulator